MMPQAVFTGLIEELGTALIAGDFQRYSDCISLPFLVEPREGRSYTLKTMSELQADFDLYHASLCTSRATEMIREIKQVRQVSETAIKATFVTHMMSGATRFVDPWTQQMELRLTSKGWRINHVISSLGHINWTLGRAEIPPDGQFEAKAQDAPDGEETG